LTAKPILQRVLPILADPKIGEPLRLESDAFVSSSSRYPVVRDIPRFVGGDAYVQSFSFEWNTHHSTQLDIYRGDRSSEEQYVQKTGFSPEEIRGKLVLDAGVGAGRYTDIASRWGADVVGVDLSFAVEASNRNFADRPNVWIAQADIGRLPFRPGSFDFIFSIGVLHHTPDTHAYFRKLVPLLKPGGTIAIWVYPAEGDYVPRADWVRFVNKIPPKMFYTWCRWYVPFMHRRTRDPLSNWFERAFPCSRQGLGLENDILDTFDGYSPRYHGIHSPEEVMGWFRQAGLVDIREPSDWHTCVRGRKPM
jgi:SAM-dependent methyltransferase